MRLQATLAAALASGAASSASAQDELVHWAVRPLGERIVVTGSRTPTQAQTIGNALTVITGDEIEAAGIRFVGDALRLAPGVAVSRTGSFGGPTQVRLRGAEANQVLVLIDGVEVASAESGEVDFASLLADDIERIEVLRGPQSGLYGSNALAGVISIVTKRGSDGATASARAEVGSFETRNGNVAGSLGDGDRYVSGALAYRESEGFNTSRLGDEKDGDENATAYLRAGAALTPIFRVDATARYVDKSADTDGFDFSGGPNQGLSVDDLSTSDTVDWNVGGSAQLDLLDGRSATLLSGAYTDTELTGGGEFGPFGGETARTKATLQSSLSFGRQYDLAHTLTGFLEHEEETYRNTVPFDPSQAGEQERASDGIGAEYRVAIQDRLFLSAAARRDMNDDFADTETFSLGASLVLEAARLHASAGTGVTNPTFFEQFGFIPGEFVGNPDLKPEEATGFDVGIEQSLFDGAAVLDVTYFQSTLQDEITPEFPTSVNQAGESERRGVEVALAAELGDAWSLNGAYTYTDAEDPDGTEEVRRPKHMASLNLSYRSPDDRIGINAGVVYNGEMLDNDSRRFFENGFVTEKSPLDAYAVVRAGADYQLTDRATLFGRVENLFDEDYEDVISYATPGRAVYAGVRVAWGE